MCRNADYTNTHTHESFASAAAVWRGAPNEYGCVWVGAHKHQPNRGEHTNKTGSRLLYIWLFCFLGELWRIVVDSLCPVCNAQCNLIQLNMDGSGIISGGLYADVM